MKTMKILCRTLLLAVLLVSCSISVPHSRESSRKIRNLILVIGDGMGPQQVGFALQLGQALRSKVLSLDQIESPLALEGILKRSEIGLVLPSGDGSLVVDSACSATALATGSVAPVEGIGIDVQGLPIETILEKAKKRGLATGLVTDTRITHATPASFAAHVPHRSDENEIARQLIESNVDVLFGGGARHFLPYGVNLSRSRTRSRFGERIGAAFAPSSKRRDNLDLLGEAAARGYRLGFDRDSLLGFSEMPALGLFASSGMPDGIAEWMSRGDPQRSVPTLAEMTAVALRLLSKDEDGFFLMVEAGQIDWAAHANDAGTLLHEMLRLDRTLREISAWIEGRDDTVVVLTADHETGSFGFSYSGYQIPPSQVIASGPFAGMKFGPRLNFGSPQVFQRLLGQSKSFYRILSDFDSLPQSQQTAAVLQPLLNDAIPFEITEKDAKRILEEKLNPYYIEGHNKLGNKMAPRIEDFDAFYPDPGDARAALIGRVLAAQQGVVWGTGTHTSTPVPVIAFGADQDIQRFNGVFEQWQLGRALQDLLLE